MFASILPEFQFQFSDKVTFQNVFSFPFCVVVQAEPNHGPVAVGGGAYTQIEVALLSLSLRFHL